MAELNKIRFLLFVLLTIFPAHAFDVIFSCAHTEIKQKARVASHFVYGESVYLGTMGRLNYQPKLDTTKIIVYIIDRSRFVEIVRYAVRETRLQIAKELSEWHCELVFLGIENFDHDEYNVIGEFMAEKIKSHPDQINFTVETIGENHFDCDCYQNSEQNFRMYQENTRICGGNLRARLRSIPRGALRPVESNINKEIQLYEYHPNVRKVRWPVSVVNNTYFPEVDVSDPNYNFKITYPDKKICLLILGGKEFSSVSRYGGRSSQRTEVIKILDEMTKNDEVLIILGAFNFDWTEIYIVTQIILKHSEGWQDSEEWKDFGYNVYTRGYGMFNTAYRNEYVNDDSYCIMQQTNSSVSEMITVLMGEEVKQRAIHVYYYDNEWKNCTTLINLINGRYVPELGFDNFTVPSLHQKIAFIVYDQTEMNVEIDYLVVGRTVEELERSGSSVILIKAVNFGLDDIHIIAEWIDCHSGIINSEQIAVLGGGIFDTIFQSKSTTYRTLFNTKKKELHRIRDAYVREGNRKRIFAAQIDTSRFDVWKYPMNTVNGFYEPDLIPDMNRFATEDGKKILFIITDGNRFRQIVALQENTGLVIVWLREEIANYYPFLEWKVFLVGLDNFGERDSHLFAELVKRQTNDVRCLREFVQTVSHGIGASAYQYKDTRPFSVDKRSEIRMLISAFFVTVG